MSIVIPPLPHSPYEGNLPFFFISYAHRKSDVVFPVIRALQDSRYRIWYDAGIEVGTEWDTYILSHIDRSDVFLLCMSQEVTESTYCSREINRAVQGRKRIIVLNLDGVDYRSKPGVLETLPPANAPEFSYCDINSYRTLSDLLETTTWVERSRDKMTIKGNTLINYVGGNSEPLIPEGITHIAPGAFLAPNALKIVLPDSVVSIGEDAFSACANLREIVMPDSITEIGPRAFRGCISLKDIHLPANLTALEEEVLSNCMSLETCQLPARLERINKMAFDECISLELVIPASVTHIEAQAFCGVKTLSIAAQNSAYACLGDAIVSADRKTLVDATRMEEPYVPEGIELIGERAFENCLQLSSLSLPASVLRVENAAFCDCANLKHAELPSTVQFIGTDLFNGCLSLENVQLGAPFNAIPARMFKDCFSIETMTLGPSVAVIGDEAFSGCIHLKQITLSEGLQVIGDSAFDSCYFLETFQMPHTVTHVGTAIFNECLSLRSAELSNRLQVLPSQLFQGCNALLEFKIPDTITRIDAMAFADCENLRNCFFSNSVEGIGFGAFQNCPRLASINLPPSCVSIGEQAFCNCASLVHVALPDGLTVVSQSLFNTCEALERVELPSAVREIDDFAFASCGQLKSLNFPPSLQRIGAYAFLGCAQLEGTLLPAGLTEIGDAAFIFCGNFGPVEVPASVTHLGLSAFNGTRGASVNLENSRYTMRGQALYTANGQVLLEYPELYFEEVFEIPPGTVGIRSYAMANNHTMHTMVVPPTLEWVGENILEHNPALQHIVFPEGELEIAEGKDANEAFYQEWIRLHGPNSVRAG